MEKTTGPPCPLADLMHWDCQKNAEPRDPRGEHSMLPEGGEAGHPSAAEEALRPKAGEAAAQHWRTAGSMH